MTSPSKASIALWLVAVPLLLSAGLAYSAGVLHYSGETSQKRRISFSVSGGSVSGLDFYIIDKCPHKKRLFVHDHGFPRMPIKESKFGGKFTAKDAVATVVVDGKVSGKTVSGQLKDHSKNKKTHKFCSGRAKFKLHPS